MLSCPARSEGVKLDDIDHRAGFDVYGVFCSSMRTPAGSRIGSLECSIGDEAQLAQRLCLLLVGEELAGEGLRELLAGVRKGSGSDDDQ